MSGWLSRARDALSGRTAETVPEPIQIPCLCGRTIETTRRESFQRVLCKSCGEPFFILPLDVYPRPVLKKVRPAKVARVASPSKLAVPVDRTTPRDSPTVKESTKSVIAAQVPDLKQKMERASQTVRRQFTPLRIIVVSLVMVLGLTGWWQRNRAALSRAEGDYTVAVEVGNTALQKKDFLGAATEFERAVHAVDLLRRTDIAAEQARQRLRELTAVNALLQASLPEILVSARLAKQKSDAVTAESNFAHLHVGRWIVLQTEIASSSSNNKQFTWDQRLQIEEDVMSFMVSLPAFLKIPAIVSSTRLASADSGGPANAPVAADQNRDSASNSDPNSESNTDGSGSREIIFAAQIKSLRWNIPESQWDLELNPTTGFLWSNFDLLIAAGLIPDELRTEEQLKTLLLEQSRWIGVAP